MSLLYSNNTSTTISDVVNSALSSTLISNSTSCAQNNTSDQVITISNIKATGGCQLKFSNFNQDANLAPNLSCSQKSENSAELKNKFSTALDQEVESKLEGIPTNLISTNTSTAISNIKNEIVNSTNISDISTCIQNNFATQLVEFNAITLDCTGCGIKCDSKGNNCVNTCAQTFDKISQSMTMNGIAKCTQDKSALVKASNELDNIIKQVATSASTGALGGLLDLFSGQSGIILAIVICVILLMVIMFKFF